MIPLSKKSRRVASIVLIFSVIFLASALKNSFAAFSARRTILMEGLGVAFDLPRGFTVFQWEDHEGFYTTGAYFGKEFRPGHFKRIPFEIGFGLGHVDCHHNPDSFKPSACVDAEYRRVKKYVQERIPGYGSDPEYVKLFGNKAVRYTRLNPNRETVIIGYLSVNQLPEPWRNFGNEYVARISFTQDIPQAEFDNAYRKLIDTVVNSLRIMK